MCSSSSAKLTPHSNVVSSSICVAIYDRISFSPIFFLFCLFLIFEGLANQFLEHSPGCLQIPECWDYSMYHHIKFYFII